MTERPILMSGAMVRATLREVDPKTQTRRVIKPQPDDLAPVEDGKKWPVREIAWPADGKYDIGYQSARADGKLFEIIQCPYGAPGDRLWVRESGWQRIKASGTFEPYYYDADFSDLAAARESFRVGFRRRPAIHMPRTACRLVLEVTGIRVERLQDISPADAMAEGHETRKDMPAAANRDAALDWYMDLWDSLNAKRGFGWSVNPWVWVVSFRRAQQLKAAA